MNLFRNTTLRIVLAIISLGLCLSAGSTIIDLWHRRDLITSRQKDLQKVVSGNSTLEKKLAQTQTDAYVEEIARDKLGLVKDGETVILMQTPQDQTGGSAGPVDTRPNWQRWWELFY